MGVVAGVLVWFSSQVNHKRKWWIGGSGTESSINVGYMLHLWGSSHGSLFAAAVLRVVLQRQ